LYLEQSEKVNVLNSRTSSSLSSLTVKQVSSFSDFLFQFRIFFQVSNDFFNWEINQHTSDLGCFVFSSNSFNIFEDEFSNLMFIVWITDIDSWNQRNTSLEICSMLLILRWKENWGVNWHLLEHVHLRLLRVRSHHLWLLLELTWHLRWHLWRETSHHLLLSWHSSHLVWSSLLHGASWVLTSSVLLSIILLSWFHLSKNFGLNEIDELCNNG